MKISSRQAHVLITYLRGVERFIIGKSEGGLVLRIPQQWFDRSRALHDEILDQQDATVRDLRGTPQFINHIWEGQGAPGKVVCRQCGEVSGRVDGKTCTGPQGKDST